MRTVIASRREHLVGCAWFWAWAPVGAGFAVSVVSFIGTLTIWPTALLAFLMGRHPTIRQSAFGLLSGAGLLLLYVAWLNRAGDGFDPRGWLVAGALFLVAGIAGHAVRERG